ncbi:MAG: DUF5318 family protein [Acidobacteria bacterium]|nr:DUF5318 family protein [Acidobacteriota bacterium]
MSASSSRSSRGDAVVEYGLVRHTLVARLAAGIIGRDDVCDAHPELLRAAKNVGRRSGERCPVCNGNDLVEVTYVFGSRLPAGGTCPLTRAELARLERRADPVQCYAVEVCTECRFHHLARRWNAGGRQGRRAGRVTS